MSSEALRTFLRWGVLLVIVSVVLFFLQKPGSAEQVITVMTVFIGLILIGLVTWIARRE